MPHTTPACGGSDKVEIDYVEKKHVKKPKGAKPGFVVYYTNYSLVIDSDISGIQSSAAWLTVKFVFVGEILCDKT